MNDAKLLEVIHAITRGFEIAGVAVILIGALFAVSLMATTWRRCGGKDAVAELRSNLGRSILLGLEFLVAADIINTVALEPSPTNVAVLGGIVLIRTFLSFTLQLEIEGRWPWQRREQGEGRGV